MKRWSHLVLSLLLGLTMTIPIYGEDDDNGVDCSQYQDPSVCTGNGNSSACQTYTSCLVSESESIQQQIADIEAQREEIAANIEYYTNLIADYNQQIDTLSVQISELNTQIATLESQISAKQAEIDETQARIDELIDAIKQRMVSNQSSMRLNQYFDFLMGATSFDDMLRRTSVLNAVSSYENAQREELDSLMDKLETDRSELEAQKVELDDAKAQVVARQEEIASQRYMAQVVAEEFQKQSADLEAQGNQLAANLESIQEAIAASGADPGPSAGWTVPVPSASTSAGTWYYPSGGMHLGQDFAAPLGSTVVAVGNGIVLNTVNGCEYGNLGNGCGNAYGGTWGGGNQIYMVVNINGHLYGIKYLHLLKDTISVSVGDAVSAGQAIAQLGSSGNSSGPHCHVEVTDLGFDGSSKQYASQWNGDLTFGAGWGLGSRCEVGGTPCRIKPESVFGTP